MNVFGCESDAMLRTEAGFIFKVVGGSDKIEAMTEPGGTEVGFTLDLLKPYYVICEEGDAFLVTDLPAQSVDEAMTGNVGYVLKKQVDNWPTREALNFSPLIWGEDRPEIVAWDDEDVLNKFIESGDQKLNPPAFREDRASTLKRERSTQPYPVLESEVKLIRGSVEKRVFDVLLPAALPAEATLEFTDKEIIEGEELKAALTGGTFAIAFDATGSMAAFAKEAAADISSAFDSLPRDVRESSKVGFVFYRDEGDAEKMFVVDPLPVADAMNALRDTAAAMDGGGDAPEPVLDAVYYAGMLFPWGGSDGQSAAGSRVVIAVLSDDAKPMTTGLINNQVPAGMDAVTLSNELATRGIKTISVQAGPTAGEYLSSVLSTLAEGTGGTFVEWGAGDRRERVTAAVAAELSSTRVASAEKGMEALSKIAFNYAGFPTIPLSVLDGEKLNALREAGIDFNINPGDNGVLIRNGYMLENPDLLQPQIQIEKQTLEGLIHLFSILGTAGVDVEGMIDSAGEALSAIAGEDYDKSAPIAELIRKRVGINFRTKLLEFDLDYLSSLVPAERLQLTKRIQEAGDKLSTYLEANLEAFDTNPAVWMPVSQLP